VAANSDFAATDSFASFPHEPVALEPPPSNSVLRASQFLIFGAAIALVGFFLWQMYLAPRPVEAPELTPTAATNEAEVTDVTQISPPQVRRLVSSAQLLATPDPNARVMAVLSGGAIIDVTGVTRVNDINWLRLSIPNDPTAIAFVREDQTEMMGEQDLGDLPPAPTPITGTPASPEKVIAGPIEVRSPTIFYIATPKAIVRTDASPDSQALGNFEFSDPITVIASRQMGTKAWYQVQLPSGGSGWISASAVSAQILNVARAAPPPVNTGGATAGAQSAEPNTGTAAADLVEPGSDTARAFDIGARIRVTTARANLRTAPDANSDNRIEAINGDTALTVEDVRIVNGLAWYKVTAASGATGWVSGRTVAGER
jgi:uncharacterized protein YgiM (DUF1202 family)